MTILTYQTDNETDIRFHETLFRETTSKNMRAISEGT